MKSIIFPSKGKIDFKDELAPKCPSNGLLLKTHFSGLTNGTERNILLGENYGGKFPANAGYQLVSEIIDCGKNIRGYSLGDFVYSGKCKGHCEYSVVKEGDLFAKLPKKFDLESAALLGVASVPHYALRKINVNSLDNIAIFGAGLIGQFTLQACKNKGAKVTIKDLDKNRLVLAKQMGADEIMCEKTPSIKKEKPYSAVFECSGADVLDRIIGTSEQKGLIDHGGNILLVAGRKEVQYNFNAAQNNEIGIIHTNHFDKIDLKFSPMKEIILPRAPDKSWGIAFVESP